MVKKNIIITVSVIGIMLLVIAVAITNNYNYKYSIENIENASVMQCDTIDSKKKLPSDCIAALNDNYCICKEQIDYNENGSEQFPDVKERVLLYEISTGEYKEIIQYPKGYYSLGFVMDDDNILWIEHCVKRENVISGSWKIKQYNIPNSEMKTIDEGAFDDFQKYAYKDIDFSDAAMLFPVNIDVSNGMLVYNKLFEKNGVLNMQIVLYNLSAGEKQVVAQSNDYINNYLYDVTISNDYVVYNSYHEKNNDSAFRHTTYKYCDIYLYDIKTKRHKKITENDFFIDIDADNGKIVAARIPESENAVEEFTNMQIVLMDINGNNKMVVLHNESPIYENKKYLMIGNPEVNGDFITWQDNTTANHREIYDYKDNCFLLFPEVNKNSEASIIGATENKIVLIEIKEDDNDDIYMIDIK